MRAAKESAGPVDCAGSRFRPHKCDFNFCSDAPGRHGPQKTPYNRFLRWSQIGAFDHIFQTLAAGSQATGAVMIDATHLKAHRPAASLLKKGLFPAASGVPRAACTQSCTRFATKTANH